MSFEQKATEGQRLRGYQQLIRGATGASVRELPLIERIMREEVFHSTLDWQTPGQFARGARLAYVRLKEDRRFYAADHKRRMALLGSTGGDKGKADCGST